MQAFANKTRSHNNAIFEEFSRTNIAEDKITFFNRAQSFPVHFGYSPFSVPMQAKTSPKSDDITS